MTKEYTPTIVISDHQFPFGFMSNRDFQQCRMIYVKTKETYRTQSEYRIIKQKIQLLRTISHDNIINIKSVQEIERGKLSIFYNYVHHSFSQLKGFSSQGIKQIHKQLIQMIIFLAKHSITTNFTQKRCGIKIVQGKMIIKYYLPLSDITITSNMKFIERSVNLFTVKSMQCLDQLSYGYDQVMVGNFQSKTSLDKRLETYQKDKKRRSSSIQQMNVFKKQNQLNQKRKMSHRFTSQSSDHKVHKSSTINTIKKHQSESQYAKSYYSSMEKYLSVKKELTDKISDVKYRSQRALFRFKEIKRKLRKSIKHRKYTQDDQSYSKKKENKCPQKQQRLNKSSRFHL